LNFFTQVSVAPAPQTSKSQFLLPAPQAEMNFEDAKLVVEKASIETISLLIKENQIDPNIKKNGDTLISGSLSEDKIKLLLDSGFSSKMSFQVTKNFIIEASEPTIVALIEKGIIDTNVTDAFGETLIFGCTLSKNKMAVLLENGLDPNKKNNVGKVFMHHVNAGNQVNSLVDLLVTITFKIKFNPNVQPCVLTYWRSSECVDMFLKVKDSANFSEPFDINRKDENGDTLLHKVNNYDMVSVLLNYGADQSIKNNKGDTPLDIVKAKGWPKIAELLRPKVDIEKILKTNMNFGIAFELIKACDCATLKALFDADILNIGTGRMLLLLGQEFEKKKFLIEYGINPNLKFDSGHTFAQMNPETFITLLESANFKVKFDPKTIITDMNSSRINGLIDYLLGYKGENLTECFNINAQNEHGDTLLHMAINIKYETECRLMVKFLLSKGADPNIKGGSGHTPQEVRPDLFGEDKDKKIAELLAKNAALEEAKDKNEALLNSLRAHLA